MSENITHVFIIGSKGIPAKYGGYETFVENLTKNKKNVNIKYHVACLAKNNARFIHNNSDCFNINVPNIGPAKAIYYDKKAFEESLNFIKTNKIQKPIIYVLTCRIGPWYKRLVNKLHKLGGLAFLNPDGHEWMRAKWSKPVRHYWHHSEKEMVKQSDLIICDSKHIEEYIKSQYKKFNPNTIYIAYGSDLTPSVLKNNDPMFLNWLKSKKLTSGNYYLSVGRFVPENNFETMIREFMASKTNKFFAIVTNENGKFYQKLKKELKFDKDPRIKFVGTVYNSELLKKIRENAFAYIHGHSVGGTNPSLLEALGYTNVNLLFDVGFNKEVGDDATLYWNMKQGNLSSLINSVDSFDEKEISNYGSKAKKRILDYYSWNYIVAKYENCFSQAFDYFKN